MNCTYSEQSLVEILHNSIRNEQRESFICLRKTQRSNKQNGGQHVVKLKYGLSLILKYWPIDFQ
jgi:hypothetical protein